jgi:hypothetical protein
MQLRTTPMISAYKRILREVKCSGQQGRRKKQHTW